MQKLCFENRCFADFLLDCSRLFRFCVGMFGLAEGSGRRCWEGCRFSRQSKKRKIPNNWRGGLFSFYRFCKVPFLQQDFSLFPINPLRFGGCWPPERWAMLGRVHPTSVLILLVHLEVIYHLSPWCNVFNCFMRSGESS